MNMNMNMFFIVVLYAALAGWILHALARVQMAWEAGQQKTTQLRQTFTAQGLTLMRNVETIQKLEDELKKVKEGIETAMREQQDKHTALAKSVRPPPPDVYVTSEFPPSQKELAWIASFVRDPRAPAMPNEIEPKPMLIWGHTQSTALSRARQLIQEYKAYSVASVGPFYSS